MNKHITIAAFLVAGAAFANAGTAYTYTNTSTGETIDLGATESWSGNGWTEASVTETLNNLSLVVGSSATTTLKIDQEVALGTLKVNGGTTEAFDVRFEFGSNGSLSVSVPANSTYGGSFQFADSTSAKVSLSVDMSNAFSSEYKTENGYYERQLIGWVGTAYNAETFAGTKGSLTSAEFLNIPGFSFGSAVYNGTVSSYEAGKVYLVVKNPLNNGVGTASGNGGLFLQYVPEPSAFGLLAGLGALALVAARRRRGRKA